VIAHGPTGGGRLATSSNNDLLLFYRNHMASLPPAMVEAAMQRGGADARLRRLSGRLATAALVLAVILPLLALWFWLAGDPSAQFARVAGARLTHAPEPWQVGMAAFLALLPSLILSTALLAAWRCFRGFAAGSYLTRDAAAALRRMGIRVGLAAGLGLVMPTVLGLVLTANAGPGQHQLVISLGSDQALGVLIGGMVWAIGEVLERAAMLADDHAQIV
jgi:hypothetical protein